MPYRSEAAFEKELRKRRWHSRTRSLATKIRIFGKYRFNMLIRNGRLMDSMDGAAEESVDLMEYEVANGGEGWVPRKLTEEDCVGEIRKELDGLNRNDRERSVGRKTTKARHRRNNAINIDKFKFFKDGYDARRRRGDMGSTANPSSGVCSETGRFSTSIS